jgi:hypothetical protein
VVTAKEFSQVELEMWQGTSLQGGNTSSVNKDAVKWLDVA